MSANPSPNPINLKVLLESKTMERAPFPVPSGWFFIDYSESVKPGELKLINIFDQEWVMFRTESRSEERRVGKECRL